MSSSAPHLPPVLDRVMAGDTCAGCGLCAGIDPAIAMTRSPLGYWRPSAVGQPKPDSNGVLEQACPGARVAPWDDAPNRHAIWGRYHRCLAAWASDPEVRHLGSSGGILSALALFALHQGLVDRVLHVGMDPDAPLLTAIRRSAGREDILAGAGSRYAPAAPLAELSAELDRPGRILFIGKPCDAGAMRQMVRTDAGLAARVPYILSFYCAGTPSQRGTDRILDRLGVKADQVTDFRYRGDGWPGSARAVTRDGQAATMSYAQSWGEILCKEVQLRCKICPDGIGGAADLAAGDAWYEDEGGYPSFAEADGRSLVLTRTTIGDTLLGQAEAAGAVASEPLDIGEIVKMQASQARRRALVAGRMMVLRAAGRPVPVADGLDLASASRHAGPLEQARNAAGIARRLWQGRL